MIAEEYIAGRELYVSIPGNERLRIPDPRVVFNEVLPDELKIATFREGTRLPQALGPEVPFARSRPALERAIADLQGITGCSRWTATAHRPRVTAAGIYFIEANPNPHLAAGRISPSRHRRPGLATRA
jgi:hypothetical protein